MANVRRRNGNSQSESPTVGGPPRTRPARMDILGIGTQVLECARVRKLIDRHGEAFLRRVYTDREIGRCNADPRTTEAFAAVWAAKDAVFRALGCAWRRGMDWTDVEIGVGNAVAVGGA